MFKTWAPLKYGARITCPRYSWFDLKIASSVNGWDFVDILLSLVVMGNGDKKEWFHLDGIKVSPFIISKSTISQSLPNKLGVVIGIIFLIVAWIPSGIWKTLLYMRSCNLGGVSWLVLITFIFQPYLHYTTLCVFIDLPITFDSGWGSRL